MRRLTHVQLCAHRGAETSIFIDAGINEAGDLILSGQDVGQAPLEHWGDSDYEYWVVVPRTHKEQLLRLLIEEHGELTGSGEGSSGTPAPGSAFAAFLKKRGAPAKGALWTESDKDSVLLMMMEQVYGGNLTASSAFLAFLKTHGVPHSFDSWV